MSSTAIGIVLGILVGLRHAFEPDHLTAVSTLVAESHSSRQGVLLGALWGVGHTISLVVVGVTLALVGATLPRRVGVAFELGVAVMLLGLGARAIASAVRATPGPAGSTPVAHEHTHAPFHVHSSILQLRRDRRRWRPLAVGLVHGLAGSGALTAIVFTQLPGIAARILYMTLFGAGSIVGMAIASGAAGIALQAVARSPAARRHLALTTGILSMTVGVLWGLPLVM